tara:strand:+ start:4283 stop:5200 length:918 start_codon:yes stop_codon:yes gene_type:complete
MGYSAGGQRGQPTQPLAPQGNFNVNNAAAGGLQQAMTGTQQAMQGPNIGQFMNPYQQMVTGGTMRDMERQRQMQMNNIGASATAAGAFGGSRQGVAESLTNEGFARQGAQAFGQLQNQGFNQALDAAQNQQNIQMGGAAQMGRLGNQAFNTGQAINNQQMQQGLMQQGLQQSLIDAAQNQFQQYANAPMQSLGAPMAALGAIPQGGGSTTAQSKSPGLFDYLSLGASAFASDARLKTDVTPAGNVGGFNFYNWKWNDEGKRIADPKQPTYGVMADEVQATHPHLVKRGEDGYLRVNYRKLMGEMV